MAKKKTKPKLETKFYFFEINLSGSLEIIVSASSLNEAQEIVDKYTNSNMYLDNRRFPDEFSEVNDVIDANIIDFFEHDDEGAE